MQSAGRSSLGDNSYCNNSLTNAALHICSAQANSSHGCAGGLLPLHGDTRMAIRQDQPPLRDCFKVTWLCAPEGKLVFSVDSQGWGLVVVGPISSSSSPGSSSIMLKSSWFFFPQVKSPHAKRTVLQVFLHQERISPPESRIIVFRAVSLTGIHIKTSRQTRMSSPRH